MGVDDKENTFRKALSDEISQKERGLCQPNEWSGAEHHELWEGNDFYGGKNP